MVKNKFYLVFVTILSVLLLAACSKPTTAIVSPTPAPTGTTAAPTQTAIPASLLLVDPAAASSAEIKSMLQAFAAANGLSYLEQVDLAGDLTGVKVAVVFGDAGVYKDRAASQNSTQFVFIGTTNETAAGNVSLVSQRPQDLAFLAGYLTSVVAEDWRSGGLLASNALPFETISNAFYNGGKYFCAYCLPTYPPFPQDINLYPSFSPLYLDISGKAGAEMTGDVATLAQYKVDTLFLAVQADMPEVLDAAEAAGMFLIGENPSSANASRYAAILGYDVKPALETMLPQLLAGQGGQTAVAKVVLVSVNNPQKITPARQALFAGTADLLAVDEIIPLSVP